MTALVRFGSSSPDRPEKIASRHHDRLAIVYIRQSSMTQVHRNQESTKLQYGLTGMAQQLGWPHERILTIDDDLGTSGRFAEGRHGFQRLLSEVAFDHVGIILGVEISRLARSNKDWHQLLELCARFGTLIADLDGLYDPSSYNDRLLLGLKGTMSEAELHILRQRLLQGKLQKARRGELSKPVPTGYLLRPSKEVVLDPDEEVRDVVRMIFDTFDRIGTINGLLMDLIRKRVQIGIRLRTGPDRDQVVWRRPHRGLLASILRNPIYAGAYAYGRRRTDPRRQLPGRPATGRIALPSSTDWQACLLNKLPAYITWEQYVRNQERLKANRIASERRLKSSHAGTALLSGLVACYRCGYRMVVDYSGSRPNGERHGRYACIHASVHFGEQMCTGLSVSARRLDEVIANLVLAALAPAALEVSMRIARELERQRAQADSLWQKKLQRARYEAERAERQYHAVEPENRLVARTLEQAWEDKLKAERALQEEHRRQCAQQPRLLTSAEQEAIRRLASDLPTLWNATTTKTSDRRTILRLLIERVVVAVDDRSEWVDLRVKWVGGHETQTRFRRPVGKLVQLGNHEALLDKIHEFVEVVTRLLASPTCLTPKAG